jgi:hypothetical protein
VRRLKSRHVQFIALGGMIGTGLFVGTGVALERAGPLSIFLAYTIVGMFLYFPVLGGRTDGGNDEERDGCVFDGTELGGDCDVVAD